MAEQWRAVVGFPSYEVSSAGRVRSWKHRHNLVREPSKQPRLLAQKTSRVGYKEVNLARDNKGHVQRVHRLVLHAFHGDPPPLAQGAHLNGVKSDNHIDNLVWATPKINAGHKRLHGVVTKPTAPMAALKLRGVTALASSGFSESEIASVLALAPTTVRKALALAPSR